MTAASLGASSVNTIAAAQRRIPSGLCSRPQMRWMILSIMVGYGSRRVLSLQCSTPIYNMAVGLETFITQSDATANAQVLNQADVTVLSWLRQIYTQPFFDLIQQARTIHLKHWKDDEIQLCTLLSIKTGGCSEDCGYCAQSARYSTGVTAEKLL